MSATGLLSKDITLSVKKDDSTFTVIPDLQSIPDMIPTVEKVDVTTLADAAKRYIEGLKDYGDLQFEFLYDNSTEASSYRVCKGLAGLIKEYKVTFPDGTEFTFSGSMSCGPKGVGTNSPLAFSAKIMLNSDIAVKDPVA